MNGHEAAALFRVIADRLEKNAPEEFGGAYLIVPPGDTEPLDNIIVGTKADPVSFWSLLRGVVETTVQELSNQAQQGGGRRGFSR